MSSSVGIELTSSATGMEQVLAKLHAGLDRTVDKLNQVEQASRKGAQAAESGFTAGAGQALKFVAALTGVGSAVGGMLAVVNQIKREYDNLVQRQRTAADTQLDFETQISQTIRNAGGLLSGQEIRDKALSIADATMADPSKAAAAIGAALSARGPQTRAQAEEAFGATTAALKFAPELDAQGVASLAGVALDLGKTTGMSPEQAIGFVQRVGGLARVTDLGGLVESVAPALRSVTGFGDSPQQAGSLVTALTQGIGDFSGKPSGTAAIALAEQLRERLPDLANTEERIRAIQADPKLFRAFFEGGKFGAKEFTPASFEKRALIPIEQLLTRGTQMDEAFSGGVGMLGGPREAEQAFHETIREVDSATRLSRLQRLFQSSTRQQSIVDTVGGQASVTREGLRDFLRQSGASDLSQRLESAIFEGQSLTGREPVSVAAERLRRQESELRNPSSFAPGGDVGERTYREPTAEERRTADAMSRLATALERFVAENRPRPVVIVNQPQTNIPVPSAAQNRRQ